MMPVSARDGWLEELLDYLDQRQDITDGGSANDYMRWYEALVLAIAGLKRARPTSIVSGLARDFMQTEIDELEDALGGGNPLGESRVSVRAADLKQLLESYDELIICR